MNQTAAIRPEKKGHVYSEWRALDELKEDLAREWQPGDPVPSVEATDELFRKICKDPKSPDVVTYGGVASKKPGAFPGMFVYREGRRDAAEHEREKLPLDEFHIKKNKEEFERKKLAEEARQLRARK